MATTSERPEANAPRLISARTDHVPQREKFSYWNEVICRTVVDLDCRPIEQPNFEASIGGFDVAGLGVYDIHTRAHLVFRGRPEITRMDSDALIINYVSAGSLYSEQDERAVDLQVGDGAICDAARPYFFRFDRPLGCISIKLDKSELRHRVDSVDGITAQSLAAGSTLNPLVFDCTRSLIRNMPTMTGPSAVRAADLLKELLVATLSEVVRRSPSALSAYRGAALLRVKSFVEEHLCDPDLDAQKVSLGVHLSTRYISKLFEAEDSSLVRHIWQRRLDRCAARLRDLAWANASISTIAMELGFNNLSHFSRAFRRRFNRSPRDYRAAGG